jgi:hypothetical protein
MSGDLTREATPDAVRVRPGADGPEAGVWTAMATDRDLDPRRGSLEVIPEAIAELVRADHFGRRRVRIHSGAEGARTPDLLAASEALFQLSYSPGKLVSGGVV